MADDIAEKSKGQLEGRDRPCTGSEVSVIVTKVMERVLPDLRSGFQRALEHEVEELLRHQRTPRPSWRSSTHCMPEAEWPAPTAGSVLRSVLLDPGGVTSSKQIVAGTLRQAAASADGGVPEGPPAMDMQLPGLVQEVSGAAAEAAPSFVSETMRVASTSETKVDGKLFKDKVRFVEEFGQTRLTEIDCAEAQSGDWFEDKPSLFLKTNRALVMKEDSVAQACTLTVSRTMSFNAILHSHSMFQHKLRRFLEHRRFESFVCLLIILNGVAFGAAVDYISRASADEATPTVLVTVNTSLFGFFTLEICVRIIAYGTHFFRGGNCLWNFFDLALVVVQAIELILSLTLMDGGHGVMNLQNDWTTLRVVRTLRLVCIVRVGRILRHVGELRTLMMSILFSMKPLFWTTVLLGLVIYVSSLYITSLVSDITKFRVLSSEAILRLREPYGSLGSTLLSMYAAITGGVDWSTLCYALMEINPWMSVAFSAYIAFCVLAMLNVATGVFVDSVLKSQAKDRDVFMVNNAREIFGGVAGGMTWGNFESKLGAAPVKAFFKAIDVDPSEAKTLFHLLDWKGSGDLTAHEFLNAALRLRSPATALDVALLMQEIRHAPRAGGKRRRSRNRSAAQDSGWASPRDGTHVGPNPLESTTDSLASEAKKHGRSPVNAQGLQGLLGMRGFRRSSTGTSLN